jgi:hypothetical protein
VHNEQTKLTATYLNGLAIAIIAIGGIAPVFSYALGSMPGLPAWVLATAAFICLIVSGILHLVARRILKRLTP